MKDKFFPLDDLSQSKNCFIPSLWEGTAPAPAGGEISFPFNGETILKWSREQLEHGEFPSQPRCFPSPALALADWLHSAAQELSTLDLDEHFLAHSMPGSQNLGAFSTEQWDGATFTCCSSCRTNGTFPAVLRQFGAPQNSPRQTQRSGLNRAAAFLFNHEIKLIFYNSFPNVEWSPGLCWMDHCWNQPWTFQSQGPRRAFPPHLSVGQKTCRFMNEISHFVPGLH